MTTDDSPKRMIWKKRKFKKTVKGNFCFITEVNHIKNTLKCNENEYKREPGCENCRPCFWRWLLKLKAHLDLDFSFVCVFVFCVVTPHLRFRIKIKTPTQNTWLSLFLEGCVFHLTTCAAQAVALCLICKNSSTFLETAEEKPFTLLMKGLF